jgi:hypothetical protein
MTTSYPGGIDNFTNPTSTDTLSSSTVPHASEHANANDAIKAIETELGTNPKGSYASVAARLAASTGSITTWRKAASGGETSLTGTDDFSTTLAYTVGQEQVFINGVLLERGVDYTATTGSSITGLTALVASDIATVISVGTFNVANAIPLSQFTAKGDILVGTGASTEAALNIGADGTTLVANSSASTGVSWAGQAFSQPVLNSAMQIWQRGTSIALAASTGYASGYTADRWNTSTGANQATTVARYATGDTTNLPNIQYCMRFQRNSGQTGTTTYTLTNNFESINSIPYAGKTITYSFYARAGADYSATSKALSAIIFTGTGTDQNVQSGYTNQATPISSTATLTTTWQRFTFTGTLASNITQIGTSFQFAPTSTAGANDYFEVTGVQIDLGSVAFPFRTNSGTLQGELAACQRYYWRQSTASAQYGFGFATSATASKYIIKTPVTMRTTPTVLDVGAGVNVGDLSTYNFATTSLVINTSGPDTVRLDATVSSGQTAYRPQAIFGASGSASDYLGFGAEL